MGRHKRKTTWKEKRESAKKQNNQQGSYPAELWNYENKAFEAYYKYILKQEFETESEFNRFINTLKEKLPVTFRINENVPNYKNFLEKIAHPDFVKKMTAAPEDKTKINEEKSQEEKKEGEGDDKEDKDEINYDAISEQIKLMNMVWYPRKLVWQLSMFRNELKKNKQFEKLHKFIQQAFDSGLITRQELVSMLPPLLLDVKSTDIIFDMCAAPGSKTSQLLELLYRDESAGLGLTQGGVLANDVDESRANMLIHQVQRISTAGMMVVNHHAQHFPTLKSDAEVQLGEINRFYFDKILCDVPCTGDGAIRKIPKKWKTWSANDGICLHPLQLQILMRAVQLAKIGGLILYSTCSINPVEDEAVVAELFRRANSDAFELVDIQPLVPGLTVRRGIFHWTVCEPKPKTMEEEGADNTIKSDKASTEPQDFFDVYESSDQLPKDYKGLIRKTMFPDTVEKMRDVYKIQHTARLMPHDQNTGGFYLALIRKKNHVVFGGKGEKEPKAASEEQKAQNVPPKQESNVMQQEDEDEKAIKELDKDVNEKEALKHTMEAEEDNKEKEKEKEVKEGGENKQGKGKNKQKDKKNKEETKKITFSELENKDWESIRDYYGFDEKLKDLLIQQSLGDKKVVMISPGVKKILDLDKGKGAVVKLNMGVKAFSRNKDSFKEQKCDYRICQDAIQSLFPLMKNKKIKCSAEEFKFFVQSPSIKYEEIQNQELRKEIQSVGQGAVVLYAEKDGVIQDLDCLACLTHAASITPMASKELINSFKLRYFDE